MNLFFPAKYQAAKQLHYSRNETERRFLWGKRAYCVENPKSAFILEGDGMDQAKCVVPRLSECPKSLSKIARVKNHISGWLLNGQKYFTITHHDFWKCDSNLTLSMLCMALANVPVPWPAVFYLQMDNCIRENKNITVFCFLALLVYHKIFDRVC